jgi:hypothetical protein
MQEKTMGAHRETAAKALQPKSTISPIRNFSVACAPHRMRRMNHAQLTRTGRCHPQDQLAAAKAREQAAEDDAPEVEVPLTVSRLTVSCTACLTFSLTVSPGGGGDTSRGGASDAHAHTVSCTACLTFSLTVSPGGGGDTSRGGASDAHAHTRAAATSGGGGAGGRRAGMLKPICSIAP